MNEKYPTYGTMYFTCTKYILKCKIMYKELIFPSIKFSSNMPKSPSNQIYLLVTHDHTPAPKHTHLFTNKQIFTNTHTIANLWDQS